MKEIIENMVIIHNTSSDSYNLFVTLSGNNIMNVIGDSMQAAIVSAKKTLKERAIYADVLNATIRDTPESCWESKVVRKGTVTMNLKVSSDYIEDIYGVNRVNRVRDLKNRVCKETFNKVTKYLKEGFNLVCFSFSTKTTVRGIVEPVATLRYADDHCEFYFIAKKTRGIDMDGNPIYIGVNRNDKVVQFIFDYMRGCPKFVARCSTEAPRFSFTR